MFDNFVWPQKLASILPCYVFLIQIIRGNCIFSHSMAKFANMAQDQRGDKHPPLVVGGFMHLEAAIAATDFPLPCGPRSLQKQAFQAATCHVITGVTLELLLMREALAYESVPRCFKSSGMKRMVRRVTMRHMRDALFCL